MNYEEFYEEIQPQEKTVKDRLAQLQKLFKAVGRETEGGDIKSLVRDLGAMSETAQLLSGSLKEIEQTVSGFDARTFYD